jgi:hypothetical protein
MLKTDRTVSKKREVHYRFLCAVLTDASPATLRSWLDDERWDWETLFRVASDELILPLLHNRLTNATGFQSTGIAEVLRDIRDGHAERNEIILDELRVLGQLSNEISIEPIVLKGGAYLLGKLYTAPSDRYMIDIDLLIPGRAIPALVGHLFKNGYSFDTSIPLGVDCHHEMCIKRPGGPGVELHRSVGMGRAGVLLPAEDMIRDSTPIRYRGATLRLPSDEHLLIHHAIHAELNHSYRQAIWPSLRSAYDCRLLVARVAGSGHLAEMLEPCGKNKCFPIVALHMRTVGESIGELAPLPALAPFSAAHIQWLHRRLLRAAPWLRFFDPYFFVRSSLGHRLYRMRNLGKSGRGLWYVVRTPFRRSFYRNVIRELF